MSATKEIGAVKKSVSFLADDFAWMQRRKDEHDIPISASVRRGLELLREKLDGASSQSLRVAKEAPAYAAKGAQKIKQAVTKKPKTKSE